MHPTDEPFGGKEVRLLGFALRQLEKGHEPWPGRKRALALVLTAAPE